MSNQPEPQPLRLPDLDRSDLTWAGTLTATFAALTVLLGGLGYLVLSTIENGTSTGSGDEPSIFRLIGLLSTVAWTSHVNFTVGGQVGTADVTFPLLLPAVLGLGAVALATRSLARRGPRLTARQYWLRIALSTAGCLLVLGVVGLVGRPSWTDSGGQQVISALAVAAVLRTGVTLVVAQLLGIVAAIPAGQRLSTLFGERIASRVSPFLPSALIAGWHVAGWTIMAVVAAPVLWFLLAREDLPFSVAILLCTIGPALLASTGTFSGVDVSLSGEGGLFGINVATIAQFFTGQGTYSVFNPAMPAAAWLAVAAGVVLSALLAARLTALRDRTQLDLAGAAATVVLLGVAWAFVLWCTGSISVSGSMAGMSLTGRAGVPVVAVLLLAGSGVVIEAAHVLIGDRLLATIPSLGRTAVTGATSRPPQAAVATDWPPPGGPEWAASAALPAPAPLSRRWLLAGLAVLLVVVLAVSVPAVASAVYAQRNGPRALATQFLEALVAGDTAKAIELGHPNVALGHRQLMTDTVYRDAVRPSSARVMKVEEKGDTVTIEAEYVLDGETIPWTFSAQRTGTGMGFLPIWELTPIELPPLSVEVGASTLRVGKHDLTLKDLPAAAAYSSDSETYTFSAPAFPGKYAFSGPNDKFRASAAVTIEATPATYSWQKNFQSYPTAIEMSWTPTYLAEANAQIKAKIDACVADFTGSEPCPYHPEFYLGEMGDRGAVTMSVKSYPQLDENYGHSPLVSGGVVVEKFSAGEWPQDSRTSNNNKVDNQNWDVTTDGDEVTVAYAPKDG